MIKSTHRVGSGELDAKYVYNANASSVRETMGGVVRERSFSYDAWGRLTTELETDGPYTIVELRSYWFDERGNRSFMRVMRMAACCTL